jgi:molybdopterin-synthase adenylyltransferase
MNVPRHAVVVTTRRMQAGGGEKMQPFGVDRYARQSLFAPIGEIGQKRLADARIAIVGLGALGTVSATQLVRAGVGYVRVIDRDIVEASNLQRQSLYDEDDAANHRPKALAAADKLRRANSSVVIEEHLVDLTWRNAEQLLTDVDLIVDGSDNFEVRYLVNDVSVKHAVPWSYGGAVASYGTTALFRPGETPCFRCVFGSQPAGGHETCDSVGVVAPVVSVIASLQTAEVLKLLTGNVHALVNGMVHVDVWKNQFQTIQLGDATVDCPCCVLKAFSFLAERADSYTVSMCGRDTVQVRPYGAQGIDLAGMADRLRKWGTVHANPHVLRLTTDSHPMTLFRDGRALIHGTNDTVLARSLYAKYVGM